MKINGFGSLSDEHIEEIENRYALSLPEDYKIFLKETNGGIVTEEHTLEISSIGEQFSLDVLFGWGLEENANISTWMDQYGDEIMDGMLIIGDSKEHGFIILGTNEYEGIYYWDDSYVFEESTDEENTFYVDQSFTKLIEKI